MTDAEGELSQLRLPAAGQTYVDGRLLPLMRAVQGQWWRARRLLLACRAVVAVSLLTIAGIAVAQPDPDAARASAIALASCAGVALIARDRLRLDAAVQASSATLQRLHRAAMDFARAAEPEKALTRLVGEIESAQDAERQHSPMVTVPPSDLPPTGQGAHADAELEALRSAMRDLELEERWQRRLGERLVSQLEWMEHHAERNRMLHQGFRLVAILAAVTVPALVSLNLTGETATWVRWATFALSLMAAMAMAVDQYFAFGEKWRHYRRVAESLKREGWSFVEGIGPYERLNLERAAHVLAEHVETILHGEVETYVRTVVAETSNPRQPAP
jgi:hypothetical protein